MRPWTIVVTLFWFILSLGCSLNYQATEVEARGAENLPDTLATGMTYRVVRSSRLSLQLEASSAETYNNRKETILSGAHFEEFDEKGERVTDGKADSVVFHTDTEDAEISGSVFVSSATEKGNITTKSLAWKKKEKLLTADPDELVVVRKEDGSYISGRGFVGDFRTKEVRFTGPVEGAYVYQEK